MSKEHFERNFAEQVDIPDLGSKAFILHGPTKEVHLRLERDGNREILMQSTIIAKSDERISKETKFLYLQGALLGLRSAKNYQANFRWIFVPTVPKMVEWGRANLDTNEADEIRTEIPSNEIELEISRLEKMIEELKAENGNLILKVETISDLEKHEEELRESVDTLRNKTDK